MTVESDSCHELRPTRAQLEEEWEISEVSSPLPRKRFWHGRFDEKLSWMPKTKIAEAPTDSPQFHALRTNLWKLDVSWRRRQPALSRLGKTLYLEFDDPTGFCRCRNLPQGDIVAWGTWHIIPWGIRFCLQDLLAPGQGCVSFTAIVSWNPYRAQPKFQQGSILLEEATGGVPGAGDMDRHPFVPPPPRQWFRPVVGTFSGVGIGEDMADFSYQDRRW